MIALQITAQGGVLMLHDDVADLAQLGPVEIIRASHVEFSNAIQRWIVVSAKTLDVLRADFLTRAEALAWEKQFYSPSGEGWKELTEEESRS